jgi:hypothetical protein
MRVWQMRKKAQEEMIGFVLIVVIIAILLLIYIGFSIRAPQKQDVESYEVESFIQASLQYTTDCKHNFGYLSVDKLIFDCLDGEICLDGRQTCEVLEEILEEINEKSWKIEDRPLEGSELKIIYEDQELIPGIIRGNKTNNYKGAVQDFSRSGKSVQIYFRAYY